MENQVALVKRNVSAVKEGKVEEELSWRGEELVNPVSWGEI